MHGVEHVGLDDLCLDDRGRDFQQRLVGKEETPFREGIHLTGKAEVRQVIKKVRVETAGLLQKGQIFGRKGKRLKKVNNFRKTRGHQEPTVRWELAHEQTEGGRREHAMLKVTR